MYFIKDGRISKHIDFVIIDILCMELSFIISYYIRHKDISLFEYSSYRNVLLLLIIANFVVCFAFYTMQDVLKRSKQLEFYATLKQTILTVIILILCLFITKTSVYVSRGVIIDFTILYFLISYIIRILYKALIKKQIQNMPNRQLVIITESDKIDSVIRKIYYTINDITVKAVVLLDIESGDKKYKLPDNLLSDNNGKVSHSEITLVDKNNLFKFLQTEYVDEVLIVKSSINVNNIIKKIVLMGIVLHVEIEDSNELYDTSKLMVDKVADMIVLTSTINSINLAQLIAKRFIDIVFGIIGSFITLILAVIIGPIIKIKSKGPVFFSQERVGKNGKIFKMYKFRSMYVDADKDKILLREQNENNDELMFKIDKDPRVIKGIGEFIRKTSIDEFPQFFNVLFGDMSVVGTRPPTLDEWNKYEMHHRARLAIKPGITGLWQVSGRSNIKNFDEVVRLDTQYIKTYSLWQDFSIIFKTIKVVINKEGAK